MKRFCDRTRRRQESGERISRDYHYLTVEQPTVSVMFADCRISFTSFAVVTIPQLYECILSLESLAANSFNLRK